MITSYLHNGRGLWFRAVVCTAALLLAAGCPGTSDGGADNGDSDNGNGDGTGGTITAKIVNVSGVIELPELEAPLSILYSVTAGQAASVESFYLRVGETTRVPISSSLPVGNGQFPFDPRAAGVGSFQVGIVVTSGSQQVTDISTGIIQVQGPPAPVFFLPAGAGEIASVQPGDDVEVTFDAGDPENEVEWRVYYVAGPDCISTGPLDQWGTELTPPGEGNVGRRIMTTAGLLAGDYRIGISAVDGGDSISTVVASGGEDRIVTVCGPIVRILSGLEPVLPVVNVLSPSGTAVELFRDEGFAIEVSAGVYEAGAVGIVEVFYDSDTNFGNGFSATIGAVTVAAIPVGQSPVTLPPFALPAGLAEGVYHIGASINDGFNPLVFDYAPASITIVRTPRLEVTAPNSSLLVRPSEPGDLSGGVEVRWSTNVPESAGRVDVNAQPLDLNGDPFGSPIEVLGPSSTSVVSAVFQPVLSGVYAISVRVLLHDSSVTAGDCAAGVCFKNAPRTVRVSTLPTILWLGSLVEEDPIFDGAAFKGIDAQDLTGSSLSPAGDLDGDGLADFLIAARYGQAGSTQTLGPGEAYLIYGASGVGKLVGEIDLRAVGTKSLKSVFFSGVAPVAGSATTDGMATVALVPDVDGDSKLELALGFPRTDSSCASAGPLCNTGQFLNGGVVIISSTNSALRSPAQGSRSIDCGAVGQRFSNENISELELVDERSFQQTGCTPGTDGTVETIVGPAEGFISLLAEAATPPGFAVIPPETPESAGVCRTQFDVSLCVTESGETVLGGADVGSGFYPAGATALEPVGARIIGSVAGSGFGTSIAWSILEEAPETDSNTCAFAFDGFCDDGGEGSFSDSCQLGTDLADCGQRFRQTGDLIISAPNINNKAGAAYIASNRNLWGEDIAVTGTLPTPYQYLMGAAGYCGAGRTPPLEPTRLTGNSADNLQNIVAIEDFNGDGFNDVAVGVPSADGGQGRVYVVFRAEAEDDVVLTNIALATNDLNRANGLLITSNDPNGLGASLATGFDFNGDGAEDLAIASPSANNGVGEVIILFNNPDLTTPAGGLSVDTLLAIRNDSGLPRAVRITGNTVGGERGRFGFNMANAGDIDGDGLDELLIAAPDATPRFDSDPTDEVDELDALGVDTDLDGVKDDVSGPNGLPDGKIDDNDNLLNAGIVYVIFGANRLDEIPDEIPSIGIERIGTAALRGFMIAGQRAGDRIGGGDAAEVASSGITQGRSRGLAPAGDVDGDGRADFLIGAILADPHPTPDTGVGVENAGTAYIVYGSVAN